MLLGVCALWAQDSGRQRTFAVSASRCAFSPATLEVQKDDLVRITFSAEDAPHSFTMDQYRIAKRAEPAKPVTFEFRADQSGQFRFYDTLAADDRCRDMHGELRVSVK
jgi:heme/copper-type cytochrome/quinol oxidase subunit 2